MGGHSAHRKFEIGKNLLGKRARDAHNRVMRTWGCLLFGLSALTLVACSSTGGQSGTEGAPDIPYCATLQAPMAIALDDQTPFGTPRAVFEAAASPPPQTADLRWYPADGSSSYVDTTLTLSVSGAASAATLASDPNSSCRALEIDGAVLHFQTADGAFNEAMAGTLNLVGGASSPFNFNAYPTQFAGTYDLAPATQQFEQPRIWLTTSLSPARGFVGVGQESSTQWVQIATWTGTLTAGAGTSAGGGAGNAAVAGSGGAAGSSE
jgi:hypothetical protein